MPAKRRVSKRRETYPSTITRLIAGEPIEETEDARGHLIEAVFFGDWPDLPRDVRQAAWDQLTAWREAASCR